MSVAEVTREDVLSVSEDTSCYGHPIIDVIKRRISRMLEVSESAANMPDNQKAYRFVRAKSRSLVEAIELATPFDLAPLDLIAIGGIITPIPRYRYLITKTVYSAYVIQETDPAIWGGYPWQSVMSRELTHRQLADYEGLTLIRDRLEVIRQNLQILEHAVFGTEEPLGSTIVRLGRRMRDGDENAAREYDEFCATISQRRIPLLDNLGDDFGNGMGGIIMDIYKTLGD